ncbi:MAG: hypothetical protein AB7I19_17425 [Planctomycetota bacterium]
MALPSRKSLLALAAAVAAFGASLSAQCGLIQPLGANLGLSDDSVSGTQPLGFNFNFNGVNYDSVIVSSNGFVYLFDTTGSVTPPTSSLCCNGNVATMLASRSPMICPFWQDLNPSQGGAVHFNALSATQATVTWDQVPEFANTGSTNTFQLVLNSNGTMDFYFSGDCQVRTHTGLTGWSEGNGAADPGASDFSAAPLTTPGFTAYELFASTTFDLGDSGFSALSLGPQWLITAAPCAGSSTYGTGCPSPADFYEQFGAGAIDLSGTAVTLAYNGIGYTVTPGGTFNPNFSANLGLGDDTLSAGNAFGFTINVPGIGAVSAVDIDSNGRCGFGLTGSDFTESLPEFLAQQLFAVCWDDLNPGAGGGVYFDAFPGMAMITWDQVPQFNNTDSNTLQIQFYANGNVVLVWQQVGMDCIVGLSTASGLATAVDISAGFSIGTGGTPTTLAAQSGSRPVLGGTFTMEAGNLPGSTILGVMNIGAINPNLALDLVGMPGCVLLSDILVNLPVTLSLPTGTSSLSIPNIPTLAGGTLNAQVVAVSPGVNLAGLVVTNGLQMRLGN